MLDVRRLGLLLALEAHGSLAAVAQARGISTSAVSQQLAKLEKDAGVPLLERVGRNVRLTPTGRSLAARASEIEAILDEVAADLEGRRSGVQGVVRIAAFSTFALDHLPRLTAELRRDHPGAVVELMHVEPAEAVSAVAGRRADIAITDEYPGVPTPIGAQLHRIRLYREEIALVAPHPCTPDALATIPLVLEPWGSGARAWALERCRALGIEPAVRFDSPDLLLHAELVRAGIAAAFLPASVRRRAGGRIGAVIRDERISSALHRDVLAVTRRGARTRPAVGAFLDILERIGAPRLDSPQSN